MAGTSGSMLRIHRAIGTGLGASMWFWVCRNPKLYVFYAYGVCSQILVQILYRAKKDGMIATFHYTP
jgi:hypothetical protein